MPIELAGGPPVRSRFRIASGFTGAPSFVVVAKGRLCAVAGALLLHPFAS